MRKKIFIIHGKGERDGIGKNGGGDLDTIASNVFYGAWAAATVPAATGAPAVYGADYEFDFVNYQQGLAHLACHRGADVYLPDFPIDALAPRLRLQRISNPGEIMVRRTLAEVAVALFFVAFAVRQQLTPEWKTLVGDLHAKAGTVLEKRTSCEIGMMGFGLFFTGEALAALAHGDAAVRTRVDDLFRGAQFAQACRALDALVRNPLKKNLLDASPQANTRLKLALDEAYRADFGILYRNQHGGQLAVTWTEAAAVQAGIVRLLADIGSDLSPADRDGLQRLAQAAAELVRAGLAAVRTLFTDLAAALPGQRERFTAAAAQTATALRFLERIPQELAGEAEPGTTRTLRAMLVEEAGGRPVAGVPVRFRLQSGAGELAVPGGPGGRSVDAVTGDDGDVTVELRLPAPDARYEVYASHDDMVMLPYRDQATIDAATGGADQTGKYELKSVSSAAVTDDADDEAEGGALDPELAVGMACRLLERDIRFLAAHDVRIARIDDHHPWTPQILDTLQRLKEEGLIEAIQLSSLRRGEEQPKEVQRCGADLIYDTFLKGQPGDNPGLALLRELAHVQDLHLRSDALAIELSKLIGSKVDKIAMVRGLMTVQSEADLRGIMAAQGWSQRVAEYEAGLAKVCPRLDATLSCLHFILPPPGGDYAQQLGMGAKLLGSLSGLGRSAAEKQAAAKRQYAEKPEHSVRFFAALAPFCDGTKGEPQINVASAIQYFSARYQPDYFLYNYGSQLMTTRRVNGASYRIDLNQVVATIGSKADGGHAEAATGKPSSNPTFPLHRFEDVKDKNYQEFLVYLAGKLQALTGLELYRVGPVRAEQTTPEVRQVLMRAARHAQLIRVGDVTILLTLHTYGDYGEPEVGLAQIHDYLSGLLPFDYLFYAYAGNQLVMINRNDAAQTLALDELARRIGTCRDGGSRVAADCVPKYCPTWPQAQFKYVNGRAFTAYAGYLIDQLRAAYPDRPVTVSIPALPLDAKMLEVATRLDKNQAQVNFHTAPGVSPRRSFRVLASLAPFTDRKKNEAELSAATALVYLRGAGRSCTHYLYCEAGYRLTMVALAAEPQLDLAAIAEQIPGRDRQVFGNTLSLTPDVPASIGKVNYKNFREYLAWLAGHIGTATACGVQNVAPV